MCYNERFAGLAAGRQVQGRLQGPALYRRILYVASHDSALKAHRQNVRRREHNRALRTRLRSALRDIRAAIDTGDAGEVKDALRTTVSLVDKMAGKGLIHRNTAGRYKSRLASRVAKKSAAAA